VTKVELEPVHPGGVLKEILEERGMSQAEFARRTGYSEKHISAVILAKTTFTPEAALRFEHALGGMPLARVLLALQAEYQTQLLRKKEVSNDSK
jgi:HTH-type transcriptional regulator / antitoxin HigA